MAKKKRKITIKIGKIQMPIVTRRGSPTSKIVTRRGFTTKPVKLVVPKPKKSTVSVGVRRTFPLVKIRTKKRKKSRK